MMLAQGIMLLPKGYAQPELIVQPLITNPPFLPSKERLVQINFKHYDFGCCKELFYASIFLLHHCFNDECL